VIDRVRPTTSKPIVVKLTPNCADVAACALAAEGAGADAVSLINTLRAYAPAPAGVPSGHLPGPWLGGGTGGLSGPAVRPIALAQVSAVAARVSIPVVGMGGIQTTCHARQFFDVGATLVAVGSESFRDPLKAGQIAQELAS
jgi:dihydroorotate dehydrogenase (NAD+) catalytic subunit